jgi:hypothetical protein
MIALHRKLFGGMVLVITAGVSMLAGGILLGTASADEPKPSGAGAKVFSIKLAGPAGEEGEAAGCRVVYSFKDGAVIPDGNGDVLTFSAAPTAALKLDSANLPEGATVFTKEFTKGEAIPAGELKDVLTFASSDSMNLADLPPPNCEALPEGLTPPDGQTPGVFFKTVSPAQKPSN